MQFLVYLIPIIAILSYSQIGKAIAEAIRANSGVGEPGNAQLQKKYEELAAKVADHEEELNKLREIIIFNEEKLTRNLNSAPDLKKLNQSNRHINLDKQ